DATYLCNKLDVQQAAPTAQGLPFFQLDLEDVWVWDKNRPTRIIPRTKVFTSGDVTIEELRGEGDEPSGAVPFGDGRGAGEVEERQQCAAGREGHRVLPDPGRCLFA
ncbi:MAG TPA: hypothetical protein DHU96_28005, partial [Actinobacteria bacterium]|nr:hypothetical protein [Actinomycetota bacterium]